MVVNGKWIDGTFVKEEDLPNETKIQSVGENRKTYD